MLDLPTGFQNDYKSNYLSYGFLQEVSVLLMSICNGEVIFLPYEKHEKNKTK